MPRRKADGHQRPQKSLQRYRVTLARPVFQITVLEIEAESHEQAVDGARLEAIFLDETEWRGKYQPDAHDYDVQEVIDLDDEEEAPLPDDDPGSDIEYAILKADTFSGEGYFLIQPWMDGQNLLMIADLTTDWERQVADTRDRWLADPQDDAEDDMEEPRSRRPTGEVIPLRRRTEEDDPDGPDAA